TDGGPPDGALGTFFSIADRLARDPSDGTARTELLDLVELVEPRRAPFGIAVRSWSLIVAAAQTLAGDFSADSFEPSDVIGHAQELRTATRPYV
ncbi:MAG TPA: hypothetical protein VGK49_02215, partial [Ilumatobacteraceae bacterium]